MNIIIAGQKAFGAAVFETLHNAGNHIVAVFAPPDTGKVDRLAAAAYNVNVAVHHGMKPDKIPDGVDLIVAAHSHDYISAASMAKTRLGAIGYHPSLLPVHRGKDAVRWAIKMNDKITGGTVYWMTDVIDGGPIAAQDWCFIRPGDTAAELWRRDLFPMGLRLLAKVVEDIKQGNIVKIEQDETLATWEPAWERPPLASLGGSD